MDIDDDDDDYDDYDDSSSFDGDSDDGDAEKPSFRDFEETKEYQESGYYQIPINQSNHFYLIKDNKFWCDLALYLLDDNNKERNMSKQSFLSKHFHLATNTFTEMMMSLSVLNLQIMDDNNDNNAVDKKVNNSDMMLSSKSGCIIFSKQLKETIVADESAINVAVRYFDPDDRYNEDYDDEDNKGDKFVDLNNFECSKIYGCRIILTNSSSAEQNVEVLYQLPTGSLPVNNGIKTKTQFVYINSYSGKKVEFYFYFPSVGTFRQYPVQISKKGKILAFAKECINKSLHVYSPNDNDNDDNKNDVDVDMSSSNNNWNQISLNGNSKEILNYIKQHNINHISMSRILWKLKDKDFFMNLCKLLREKLFYDEQIWEYSVYHKSLPELNEYLNNSWKSQIVNKYLEPSFLSSWINYNYLFNNNNNKIYKHLEYHPLINSRIHKFGHNIQRKKILNSKLKQQYESFLQRIIYLGTNINNLPIKTLLEVVYYLILQDRIYESVQLFNVISGRKQNTKDGNNDNLNENLQFDYLGCYLSFYRNTDNETDKEWTNSVLNIVNKYKNIELTDIWRNRLLNRVESTLNELKQFEGFNQTNKYNKNNNNKIMETQPMLQFEIIGDKHKIKLIYKNIKIIQVNYYKIDIELLFSFSPFLLENNNKKSVFSYLQPTETQIIDLLNIDNNDNNNNTTNDKMEMDDDKDNNEDEDVDLIISKPKIHEFDIPNLLKQTNLFLQILPLKPSNLTKDLNPSSQTFYDNQLIIEINESYGRLRVLDKKYMKPIHSAYIKIYVKLKNNNKTLFHKDCYSDIRGQCDYISLSCNHLLSIKKLALLIVTEKHGSIVKIVNPPKQIINS